MAVSPIQGFLYEDTDMDDGYVRAEPFGKFDTLLYLTRATYRALFYTQGAIPRLWDALGGREGTFLLPRAVIEPEAASDLRLGLSLVDAEPSEYCAFQPCILRATVDRPEGFSLCDYHATLMADWDDLIAA